MNNDQENNIQNNLLFWQKFEVKTDRYVYDNLITSDITLEKIII